MAENANDILDEGVDLAQRLKSLLIRLPVEGVDILQDAANTGLDFTQDGVLTLDRVVDRVVDKLQELKG